jgi:hypothetical protein
MKKNTFLASMMVIILALVTAIPITGFTGFEKKVDINGFVGLDDESDVNDNLEPDDLMIDITLTSESTWIATDKTDRDIVSAEHQIRNNSKNIALRVTLVSFTPTNDAAKNLDGLVLGLTGDLAKDNIVGYTNVENTPYANPLGTESTWKFGFKGRYEGLFPVPALQPTYSMVLNFEVAGLRP